MMIQCAFDQLSHPHNLGVAFGRGIVAALTKLLYPMGYRLIPWTACGSLTSALAVKARAPLSSIFAPALRRAQRHWNS